MRHLLAAVLIAASVLASPALAALSAIHPAIVQHPDARPRKVVLLPPQVFVYELSAGGVPTRMADWEAAARDNVSAAALRVAHESGLFEVIPAPALAGEARERLEAHIGLYERVAQSVFSFGRGTQGAWAHKQQEFDYTLGPGLAFLRDETGADAALIVLGADFISSAGRRAAFIAGLALGVVMPLGQAFMTAGVVDLETGDVQWMGFDSSASLDSRQADDMASLLRDFFRTWPGQK